MNYLITTTNGELYHHGILGQKWGVRRYQNPDGSLTAAGRRHKARIEKKDTRWADKNYDKIMSKTEKKIRKPLAQYDKTLINYGYKGAKFVNAHNYAMAELMNKAASDLRAPSGRSVKFVAQRGALGVHMALADEGYDMSQLSRGVWGDGRIAYKKNKVNMT